MDLPLPISPTAAIQDYCWATNPPVAKHPHRNLGTVSELGKPALSPYQETNSAVVSSSADGFSKGYTSQLGTACLTLKIVQRVKLTVPPAEEPVMFASTAGGLTDIPECKPSNAFV